jgi:hypothetical protein
MTGAGRPAGIADRIARLVGIAGAGTVVVVLIAALVGHGQAKTFAELALLAGIVCAVLAAVVPPLLRLPWLDIVLDLVSLNARARILGARSRR